MWITIPSCIGRLFLESKKSFHDWNDKTKRKFKRASQSPDIQSLLGDYTNSNYIVLISRQID